MDEFSHIAASYTFGFAHPPTSGTRPEKIRLQKWYTIFKDHITLSDYEIHDGGSLIFMRERGLLKIDLDSDGCFDLRSG